MKTIKLWDLPLRVFHWLLAFLVVTAFVTGLTGGGLMDWHGRAGAAIAALLGFRLTWGFVGSIYSRFKTFVKGPASIATYLKGQWRGVGHNPLGALSVVGMLGILLLQVLTGLPSNDDVAFRGPYNVLVSKDIELLAIYLHKRLIWVLALLVLLHVAAVAYYTKIKGENLVKPMLTGLKELPPSASGHATPVPEAKHGGFAPLILALCVAGIAAWLALGGPAKYLAPPPPPATETPNW